jgi:ketosteroid isomerase-like protein
MAGPGGEVAAAEGRGRGVRRASDPDRERVVGALKGAFVPGMVAKDEFRPAGGPGVTKYTSDSSNFGADGPFFRIIREGLEGLADGEDYFDLLTDDVVFEYVISVPGYPRRVEGRQNIIDLYSGYGDFMAVYSADHLRVYRDREASVVVLEYEVHGESVQTGRPYSNRFVSVITVKDRKVTHWRDYLDPIAVFDAAGWPGTPQQ